MHHVYTTTDHSSGLVLKIVSDLHLKVMHQDQFYCTQLKCKLYIVQFNAVN